MILRPWSSVTSVGTINTATRLIPGLACLSSFMRLPTSSGPKKDKLYRGLAVFAGGQSDANPYVLLLTCLIAAVFSEKVWARANEYLVEKLQGREQKPKGTTGGTTGATGDYVCKKERSVTETEGGDAQERGYKSETLV